MPETNPRKAFLSSPHHAALGLVAAGCVASAAPLAAIAGLVAYVLGWVYLPDMPLFTRWREKKAEEEEEAVRQTELGEFAVQRDALLSQLAGSRTQRHAAFVRTCQQVAMGQDPRARRVEEMQWTYLRLLTIEQSLEVFLEGERRDSVPQHLREAADEVEALEREVADLKAQNATTLTAKERLLESRKSRLSHEGGDLRIYVGDKLMTGHVEGIFMCVFGLHKALEERGLLLVHK